MPVIEIDSAYQQMVCAGIMSSGAQKAFPIIQKGKGGKVIVCNDHSKPLFVSQMQISAKPAWNKKISKSKYILYL